MERGKLVEVAVEEISTVGEETAAVQTPQKTPRQFATSSGQEKKALEMQASMRMIQPRISRRPRHRRVPENRANKEPPKHERRLHSKQRHGKPKHARRQLRKREKRLQVKKISTRSQRAFPIDSLDGCQVSFKMLRMRACRH
jgi:hypothetical protein